MTVAQNFPSLQRNRLCRQNVERMVQRPSLGVMPKKPIAGFCGKLEAVVARTRLKVAKERRPPHRGQLFTEPINHNPLRKWILRVC